jgi:pimeloyl-ACP methyl ester carboxylesterase
MEPTHRRGGSRLKKLLLALLAAAVLFLCVLALGRGINAVRIHIGSENGVQESVYLTLCGAKQYVQIRGQDTDNPVLIFLHGGPGSPVSGVSYTYQLPLEEDYIVVNWDQRGCGRTYYAENGDTNVTAAQLLLDLDALVSYCQVRFDEQKVYLVGYSFGSALGLQYAAGHPENVAAYLGVGQVVKMSDGVAYAAGIAEKNARAAGQAADAAQLEALLLALNDDTVSDLSAHFASYRALTSLSAKYLPASPGFSRKLFWQGAFSPQFWFRDGAWRLKQSFAPRDASAVQAQLMQYLYLEFDAARYTQFSVPVYFLTGEYDYTTPGALTQEYCGSITAPDTAYMSLPGAGHGLMFQQPDAFCAAVKTLLAG